MKKNTIPIYNSIQTRIIGVMLLILGAILCMNIFIFIQINSAVQRIDAVFSSNVTMNTLADTLGKVQDTVYEYLNTRGTQALENYYRYEQDYREGLEALNDQNVDNEIKMLEKNIRNMSESYLDKTEEALQAKRGRNVKKYRDTYEDAAKLYQYINSYIYRLNNLQLNKNSENYQRLLSSMQFLEQVSMGIMIVIFAIGIIVAAFLIKEMVKPLMLLADAAHKVANGSLDAELPREVSRDEIGIVTTAFNQMMESIREYIEKLKESMEKEARMKEKGLTMEAHLKDARLKFLQAQINPHFLFNSINAGAQLAMLEDAEKTAVFLEKMADFFRYNVKKVGETANLLEEIKMVDNYIYILNVRFTGDILYTRTVSEEIGNLEDVYMPSMILQPIVENAFSHGLKDHIENGRISLTVSRSRDSLLIVVEDNGKGMSKELIRQIMNGTLCREEKTGGSTGVGLDNVMNRLRLYYDREDVLKIESGGEGAGTKVTLKLPWEMGGRKDV